MDCPDVDPRVIRAATRAEIRVMNARARQGRRDARQARRHERDGGIFGLTWEQVTDLVQQVISSESGPVASLDEDRIVSLVWRRLDMMTPGVDLRAAEGAARLLIGPIVRRAVESVIEWASKKTKRARDEVLVEIEREAADDPAGDAT